MPRASHVSLDVIDTINLLPQRSYGAMLDLFLQLRTLPQERYDVLVEAISLRALRRHIDMNDVKEMGRILTDDRADDAFFDWFLKEEYFFAQNARRRLEANSSASDRPEA